MWLNSFMISFNSSFKIIDVVIREDNSEWWPDPNIFLWITASIADAAAVKPTGSKTLLANGLSTFALKAIQFLVMVLKVYLKIDCPILCDWVFDIFILADKPFGKTIQSLETCVLVNNNLCGKLFSSLESPTTFDESFQVTPVPFVFLILIN